MNVDPFEFFFGNHSNLLCDESPNPKQDNNPSSSSYLNFTPPFLDEHELPLNEIFSQNHTRPSIHQEETISLEKAVDEPISHVAITQGFKRRKLGGVAQGKRDGKKKDRHSKICTASGIRDRRMRLSVQVARKFFDLQDMLGYDKASKTIDWLFTKSSQAINQLIMIKDHPPQLQANYKTDEIKNQVVSCNKSNPNSEEDVKNQSADEGTIEKLLLGSSTPSKSCPKSSCNNNNQCSVAPSGCVDDDNNNDIINRNLRGFCTNWDTFNYHSRSLLSHDHDDVSDQQVSLQAGEP